MTGSPTPPIRRPSCSGGSTASMARPAGPTRRPAITATTASFSIDRTRRGERSHVPALGRHAQPARCGDIAFRRGARAHRGAFGLLLRPAGRGQLPERRAPAPPDRDPRGRARARNIRRRRSRRPHPRAAGRRRRVRAPMAARGDRPDDDRGAGGDRQRDRGCRGASRDPIGPVGDRRSAGCGRRAPVSPGGPDAACDHPDPLSEHDRGGGTLRAMAPRYRPEPRRRRLPEPRILELRLRQSAQPGRHGGEPGGSGAAARRYSGLCGAALDRAGEIPQGRGTIRQVCDRQRRQDQRPHQMMRNAVKSSETDAAGATPAAAAHIAPLPRVSIQAFCEAAETAAVMQAAGEDRRMAKAHVKVQMGGIAAAAEAYRSSPTPNVILIESGNRGEDLLAGLDQLAEVCDAASRVIVVGRVNDVVLYRELVRRGVSDYLIAPVDALGLIRAVSGLFSAPDVKPVGRTIAVIGAKGGVGASTIAHNIAWALARDLRLDSVVADLDLAFGTAGLDYNQDPSQGIADAVFSPDRVDTAFVDRLLSKCTDHLSLLAAPATLERVYDFGAEAFDSIFDTLRTTVPCIVLDMPHQWSAWTKRALIGADDILIVASPDLANLRNSKNIFDLLKASRPNDRAPLYCLNQVGVPKRPEINASEFAKAIESPPIAAIPFDPQIFGLAANNGQMIAEIADSHRTTEMFLQIAQRLTGRGETKKPRGSLLSPLIGKLRAK